MAGHTRVFQERGRQLSELLRGAWRAEPPAPAVSPAALAELVPLLLDSASSSLAWWRLRASEHRDSAAAQALREGYRFHTLQAALLEQQLAETVGVLRAAGVEPILIKGWAMARLYPEPGLRPYRDLDLCVRPADLARAEVAVAGLRSAGYPLEVKPSCPDLEGTSFDELYARAHTVSLDSLPIRILSREDHLRLLSVHMFRHGVSRPLWLCDIAVLLETETQELDWEHCLGGDYPGHCVIFAVGLASQLFGRPLPVPAAAAGAGRLPHWLVPAVLRQWGSPAAERRSLRTCLHPAGGLLEELRLRWPNPVSATTRCGGPFNAAPRLPFQLAQYLRLGSRSLKALARRPARDSESDTA